MGVPDAPVFLIVCMIDFNWNRRKWNCPDYLIWYNNGNQFGEGRIPENRHRLGEFNCAVEEMRSL